MILRAFLTKHIWHILFISIIICTAIFMLEKMLLEFMIKVREYQQDSFLKKNAKNIKHSTQVAQIRGTLIVYFLLLILGFVTRIFSNDDLPLCLESDLLIQGCYNTAMWEKMPDKTNCRKPIRSCRIVQYTIEGIVKCIDTIDLHKRYDIQEAESSFENEMNVDIKPKGKLHISFIGDSRVRQQFFNFLKLIPEFDRRTDPNPIPVHYHDDIDVTSELLNLWVSFRWCPVIHNSSMEMIRELATSSHRFPAPHLVLLSMGPHHMLPENSDFKDYQQKLAEFGPILDQLAEISQVIWMNQYPTMEMYDNITTHNKEIHGEIIRQYNEAVHHIFKSRADNNTILIWDSTEPIIREYIRSCTIHQRKSKGKFYIFSYVNCHDYIHAGYSALSHATQLLFNNICNFV